MNERTVVGSMVHGRIADVPFLKEDALERILNDTGLELDQGIEKENLLRELNSLAATFLNVEVKAPISAEDIGQLRNSLEYYFENSRRLRTSWFPPPLLNKSWYEDAIRRLTQDETEISSNVRRGRRSYDNFEDHFIPQIMGIFSAAYDQEPKSTIPTDYAKPGKVSGPTIRFILKVLEETAQEADNRLPEGISARTQFPVLSYTGLSGAKSISQAILRAKKVEAKNFGKFQDVIQDHCCWKVVARQQRVALRNSPE